jgi:hypothetical protein
MGILRWLCSIVGAKGESQGRTGGTEQVEEKCDVGGVDEVNQEGPNGQHDEKRAPGRAAITAAS